jgi:hypothetical protein
MSDTNKITATTQNIPTHVIVSAIIILVVSIIGIAFYLTASIYQLYNPQFLVGININQYTNLNIYVIVQSISHIGLLISAIYILKLRKIGLYLYFISALLLLAVELFFDNEFLLVYLIASILLGLIFTISFSKFR